VPTMGVPYFGPLNPFQGKPFVDEIPQGLGSSTFMIHI
jgi:hypothetical protein